MGMEKRFGKLKEMRWMKEEWKRGIGGIVIGGDRKLEMKK